MMETNNSTLSDTWHMLALAAALTCVGLAVDGRAQRHSPGVSPSAGQVTFRTSVELVALNVTVPDRQKRFIQMDSNALALRLLEEAHVVTIPGSSSGRRGEGCLRLDRRVA